MNERRQDFELLQRFTRSGDQSAFADVVRRHLDLVYGTALRKVEDPGAAQEVSQNVFAALGRKAWQFAHAAALFRRFVPYATQHANPAVTAGFSW